MNRNQKYVTGEGLLAVLTALKKTVGNAIASQAGGEGLRTYESIDSLLLSGTAGLTEGSEFKILGYYKAGDGGGAQYTAMYLYDPDTYPWAIDIGEINEIEYEVELDYNSRPKRDANTGAYIFVTDAQGHKVPRLDSNGQPRKKHLYACITNHVVNYAQFGAKLDGVTDDYWPIYLCHLYQQNNFTIEPLSGRRHYYIKVENHHGIIHKKNNEPIQCCGNIDLSGSQLVITDDNAAWFGFYLWGDNESDYQSYEPSQDVFDMFTRDRFVIQSESAYSKLRPNSLLFLTEDRYAVRDDSGYLYSVPRYELLLHTLDGVMATPFTYDWTHPGGVEIQSSVSDYSTHTVKASLTNSHVKTSYTRLPSTHYSFIGCDVKLNVTANKYCSVLWCKCHNAHISGFTIEPTSTELHNTVFKNAMIYLWGSYNVEVSDIVGFNAAGKMSNGSNGTSGYVIRVTNCLNVRLHDISVQGYWGATAMNCVKDIHIERVNINRLDIHNYFYNLYIDQCNLYNHAIQIGEGRGIVQITNSNFYINALADDSYPNAHLLEFNLTYGRIFEGSVLIQNCNAYVQGAHGNEFDVCKLEFSPEAVSSLDSFKFPEVTIRDCSFWSHDDDTYLVYFMVAGTRTCKSSITGPTNVTGVIRDAGNDANGTLTWRFIGRGVDWTPNDTTTSINVVKGQYIRTYDTFENSDGKTTFYNFRYFLVTEGGTLPAITQANRPSDLSGNEFTLGTAKVKAVNRHKWETSRAYVVGDTCFTETSSWFPVYCYECIKEGISNGYRPTHTNGTVIDGLNQYPQEQDSCWWMYVDTMDAFVSKLFTPKMSVTTNEILYADNRLYKVIYGGTLLDTPPMQTAWVGTFQEGTAVLSFIGKDWQSKSWWRKESYCISYDETGVAQVYQLVRHDGTTSGDIPVPGSGRVVDGDMIWQYTTDPATKVWTANTRFYKGDVVSHQGNNYRCVFDGRLELPHRTVIENVSSNMTHGILFDFWNDTGGGTDIPTVATKPWRIDVKNVEVLSFRQFHNGYFCHSGNPQPLIVDSTIRQSTIKTISDATPGQSTDNTPTVTPPTVDSGNETDTSPTTELATFTTHADAQGNLSGYTLTRFVKKIPNNKTVHFKAELICPSGVVVNNNGADMNVSDFKQGRAFDNKNAYCTRPLIKQQGDGYAYIFDWDEPIAVTDATKVTEDDLTQQLVTYYCCTEITLTGDSTKYTDVTLTISAYVA